MGVPGTGGKHHPRHEVEVALQQGDGELQHVVGELQQELGELQQQLVQVALVVDELEVGNGLLDVLQQQLGELVQLEHSRKPAVALQAQLVVDEELVHPSSNHHQSSIQHQ